MVAKGRFGNVWKGLAQGGTFVAVKVFPLCDADSWVQEQEIFSVDAMKHHPNIVAFLGAQVCGCGPSTEYWLLMQYHRHGSLAQFLRVSAY
jgi:serine/threonine protein kinase